MSRNRSASEPEDSLDLLLDTICNTFGGIVFISILVVMMANVSGESAATSLPDPTAQSQLVELEINREQTHARLARLRRAAVNRKAAFKQFTSRASVEMAHKVQSQDLQHARLVEQKSDQLGRIGRLQIHTNAVAQAMKQRRQTIEQRKVKLASLQRTLKSEVQSRTRNVDLPRLRTTKKKPITFFLKNSRLFAVHKPGRHGTRWETLSLSNEVVTSKSAGRTFVEPKPGSGTPVAGQKAALRQKLKPFDPQHYYIQIFVWDDSFKEFVTVRSLLVGEQFEYALVPMAKNKKVFIGAGRADLVQ